MMASLNWNDLACNLLCIRTSNLRLGLSALILFLAMKCLYTMDIGRRYSRQDSQWNDKTGCLRSMKSKLGHGAVEILFGYVTAFGMHSDRESTLHFYWAASKDGKRIAMMANGQKFLMCVANGHLSSRRGRQDEFVNINNAGDDAKFHMIHVNASIFRFKFLNGPGYVGFDENGNAMKLSDVRGDSKESEFFFH